MRNATRARLVINAVRVLVARRMGDTVHYAATQAKAPPASVRS